MTSTINPSLVPPARKPFPIHELWAGGYPHQPMCLWSGYSSLSGSQDSDGSQLATVSGQQSSTLRLKSFWSKIGPAEQGEEERDARPKTARIDPE